MGFAIFLGKQPNRNITAKLLAMNQSQGNKLLSVMDNQGKFLS
jgi:hypothetical protein